MALTMLGITACVDSFTSLTPTSDLPNQASRVLNDTLFISQEALAISIFATAGEPSQGTRSTTRSITVRSWLYLNADLQLHLGGIRVVDSLGKIYRFQEIFLNNVIMDSDIITLSKGHDQQLKCYVATRDDAITLPLTLILDSLRQMDTNTFLNLGRIRFSSH